MRRVSEAPIELDRTIDALLREGSLEVPDAEGELAATARLLRDTLPRLHPRFTFEQHLAARLAGARAPEPTTASAVPVPIGPQVVLPDVAEPAPLSGPGDHRRLGLVAGGAIASGVSLAGAALVVWRRTRSSGGPF